MDINLLLFFSFFLFLFFVQAIMFSFQVLPDRIGHKLQWPKNTDYINYKVRPPLFWPEIIFWLAFFIGWQFAIRAILHHLGFQCVTTAEGGPNAVEVIVQSIISRFSLLPAAVIFLLSGQGFTRHSILVLVISSVFTNTV